MKTPIEQLLDQVKWESIDIDDVESPDGSNLPYATHRGILNISGVEIDCYVLSNGQRVLSGAFMDELVQGLLG